MSSTSFFRGKDAILRAYGFNAVAPWAIFVGKDPMFSYKGEDMSEGEEKLAMVIDNMTDCMGQGTYQLRVYEDLAGKGITNKTEFNYSFRFQLLDEGEYNERNPNRTIREMQKRIEELEGEEEEEDDSFMGRVGKFMQQRPEIENFLMQKIMGWANQVFGPKPPVPANMAGFTTMDTTQQQPDQSQPSFADLYNRLSPEERQKFDQATYFLLGNDPAIGTHLLKLATLLQNQPATYDALTKM